jgi:hypothetical protein
MPSRHTITSELRCSVEMAVRPRTFVPHASAIAVAAITEMMRVFLWVVASSWGTMMVNEGCEAIVSGRSSSLRWCRGLVSEVGW